MIEGIWAVGTEGICLYGNLLTSVVDGMETPLVENHLPQL